LIGPTFVTSIATATQKPVPLVAVAQVQSPVTLKTLN